MKAKQVLSTDFEDKNGRTDKKPLMRYFTAMKPRAGSDQLWMIRAEISNRYGRKRKTQPRIRVLPAVSF